MKTAETTILGVLLHGDSACAVYYPQIYCDGKHVQDVPRGFLLFDLCPSLCNWYNSDIQRHILEVASRHKIHPEKRKQWRRNARCGYRGGKGAPWSFVLPCESLQEHHIVSFRLDALRFVLRMHVYPSFRLTKESAT